MTVPFLTEAAALLTSSTVRFIAFEILLLFISALFIWVGAKIADVKKGTIIKAFLVALAVAIITPLLLLPFAGFELVSAVLSIIINLAIIKIVFKTGWRKSIVTWVFSLIAGFLSVILLIFVLVFLA